MFKKLQAYINFWMSLNKTHRLKFFKGKSSVLFFVKLTLQLSTFEKNGSMYFKQSMVNAQ